MNEPNDPSSRLVIAPTMITSGRRLPPTEPKTRWTRRCVNSPGPDRNPMEVPMFENPTLPLIDADQLGEARRACSVCGVTKPITDFHWKGSRAPGKRRLYCKSCGKIKTTMDRRARPAEARRAIARKATLKSSYGMTVEQFTAMSEAQGGVCAICRKPQSHGRQTNLHVDHDHDTGKVRGLLCNNCNNGLGRFKDRPDLLVRAARYLMGTAVVAFVLMVLGASAASAHVPQVSHNCSAAGATLTVVLTQYEKGSTVTVNGVKSEFGTAKYDTTVTLGPATASHVWKVEIDNRGDGMKKSDKFDSTFTDTVAACVTAPPAEIPSITPPVSVDLTPQTPPKVEYVNPAWPICMVPGKHLYNAHDPECVDTPVVMAPPAVLERQPVALAFTGVEAYQLVILAALFIGAGAVTIKTGRAINKEAN